MNRPKDDV